MFECVPDAGSQICAALPRSESFRSLFFSFFSFFFQIFRDGTAGLVQQGRDAQMEAWMISMTWGRGRGGIKGPFWRNQGRFTQSHSLTCLIELLN